jgi:regulator of ribosome biosynthesis
LIANVYSSPITVAKENPYTFDLGHLMVQDPNPLVISPSENTNDALKAVARDGAQVLINQLLVRKK